MRKPKEATQKQIENNSHIPTSEIEKDIEDTKREIERMREENKLLNVQEDRVRIYMNEGRIRKRAEFIDQLEQILCYRDQNK